MQSLIYQEHYKHAMRRDGEIYASMAADIYDTPRKTFIVLPDDTRKQVEIMQSVIDNETGDLVFLNDLRNTEFEVFSKIGARYSTQKEQTINRLEQMITMAEPGDPIKKILQLKLLKLLDGIDFDDIRDYANKQLVILGVKKPETPEEMTFLQQVQSQPKEDPAMVLAKAEELKGQAAMLDKQQENIAMRLNDENEKAKNAINAYKAETERMELRLKAEELNAKGKVASLQIESQQLENIKKLKEIKQNREKIYESTKAISDDEEI